MGEYLKFDRAYDPPRFLHGASKPIVGRSAPAPRTRLPWWHRNSPPDASATAVLKTVYDVVAAHLSEDDRKNFDIAVWNNNAGAKTHSILMLAPVFASVCGHLSDDDRASFHQAIDPPWKPWFYSPRARVDWRLACRTYRFTLEELFRFRLQISWHDVVLDQHLLWRARKAADWRALSETRYFTTKEMIRFKKYIRFDILDINQRLTRRQIYLLEHEKVSWRRTDSDALTT